MENVVLTVHLILALLLIGVVLLQRSEGGGLGMGGGSGVMTGRQAANALTRGTWIIASAFLVTSIALTVIAARNSVGASVVDRISPARDSAPATGLPTLPTYTPPPGVGQPAMRHWIQLQGAYHPSNHGVPSSGFRVPGTRTKAGRSHARVAGLFRLRTSRRRRRPWSKGGEQHYARRASSTPTPWVLGWTLSSLVCWSGFASDVRRSHLAV